MKSLRLLFVETATGPIGRRRAPLAGARRLALILAVSASMLLAVGAPAAEEDLADIELEDLFDMEVTSLTMTASKLSNTPAAIYVLTGDDIRRSGARSIPDALRMVPGVQVAQLSGNKYAISARGFAGLFSDKMLVLQDGRSLYTPLYAGVYWDVQDLLIEDIDRIEVIRGPGGVLWGANAVNGVINIVTKKAEDSQGVYVNGGGGDPEKGFAAIRYGGELKEDIHYRGYFKFDDQGRYADPDPLNGEFAHDASRYYRGGGRVDWTPTESDFFTLQGDGYSGDSEGTFLTVLTRVLPLDFPRIPTTSEVQGGNVLARWSHTFSDRQDLALKFYWDRTERSDISWSELRDTWDVEFQHHIALPFETDFNWGLHYRRTSDDVKPGIEVVYIPPSQSENLATGFLQLDGAYLDDRLRIILGTKLLYNDHTGFEYQPSARMTVDPIPRDWKIGDHTLWASFTRAIRLPSRSTDDILVYPVGSPIEVVVGNPDVVSEEVLAYEAGYRVEPIDRVQIDLAGYYNDYDNVLSLEMTPGGPLGLPVVWGNLIAGDGYGVELSAGYKPWDWIEVGISYTWARLDLHQKVGGTSDDIGDVGIGTSRVDEALPEHMLSVRLSLDLPYDIEFDTYVYYMDEIRLFPIDSYVRLDFRVGWAPTEWLELAGAVQNVTDDSHQEWQYEFQFTETLVPRGYWVGATLRF